MERVFLVAMAMAGAVVGCLAPPAPAGPEAPRARWVLEVDGADVTIDGVRGRANDLKRIERACLAHWKEEPVVNVAPSAPVLSVRRVLDGGNLAKLHVMTVTTGAYTRDFWTTWLRSEPRAKVLSIHAVGGDVVRFRRFEISEDPTSPLPFVQADWDLHDDGSAAALRGWLATNGRGLEQASLVTLENAPFGEITRVLSRLTGLWPEASALRLTIQEPVRLGLDSRLEERLSADTIPPAIVYPSLGRVAEKLYDCYLRRTLPDSPMAKIFLTVRIDASGATTAKIDPGTINEDPRILECVLERLATLRYPPREGAADVTARQAYAFHPSSKPRR